MLSLRASGVCRALVARPADQPKSRHGLRIVPISSDLASALLPFATQRAEDDDLLFRGPRGAALQPNNLRNRVLPAAERAGVPWARFHTLRHTCPSLAEAGAGPLRPHRWMGHHSASYTLDTYGHLIDGDLALSLDLARELGN